MICNSLTPEVLQVERNELSEISQGGLGWECHIFALPLVEFQFHVVARLHI